MSTKQIETAITAVVVVGLVVAYSHVLLTIINAL